MRIAVFGAFQMGSIYAHAINTIKMAEGFAKLGNDVTLVCRGINNSSYDIENKYALNYNFKIIYLREKLLTKTLNSHWHFSLQSIPQILKIRPQFIYARHFIIPIISSLLGIPSCCESHAHPDSTDSNLHFMAKYSKLCKFKALVTISPILKEGFIKKGVDKNKIIVLSDAVDLDNFHFSEKLHSPYSKEGIHIVYAGHLYDYKGIPTILQAAKLLPSLFFHLIGGTKEDIQRIKYAINENHISNIILHGFINRKDLPKYLYNADILLLPPSLKHPSASWTSPVKLCEYFASKVPVIASKIPALEYWLKHDEVYWIRPYSPEEMAAGITFLLSKRDISKKIVSNAFRYAIYNDYKDRAKRIIDFCL